jgi:hypothetical protein
MSFTTKRYTRPVLLSSLKSINARKYSSFSSFVSAFSPRAGVSSAKINALVTTLNTSIGALSSLFVNNQASVVKKTLISAIKNQLK